MDIYNRLIDILCSFKVYNKDNIYLQGEVYAFAKGLEIIADRLEQMEKECFVQTAEEYGLSVKEKYFDSIQRSENVEDRRELLLSILSVDETDFNMDGMKKFMSQFPVTTTITEFSTSSMINISLKKNDWIDENFDFVKSCVEDFFPSHLEHHLQIVT